MKFSSLITIVSVISSCIWALSCNNFNDEIERPNIILIVSDDQGYNDIAEYGADDILTPNLDQLVREGILLTSFYVTSSVCTPSRGSLLTGRYPQRNGTYELFRNELPDMGHKYTPIEYSTTPERILGTDLREVFISEVLKGAGYRNGIFGKWDLGQLKRFLPLQQGFDVFYGFVNTGIDYFTHERYGVHSMYKNNELTKAGSGIYSTSLFEREAISFLQNTGDDPFFLYLPFNAPHSSSNLDPKIRSTVQAPEKYLLMYPGDTLPEKIKRRDYKAAITAMDYAIGNILNEVQSMGKEKNTLVIFLSDNGGGVGSDNSPFRGSKAHFLEGGIRVPCIIKWPGVIKAGTVNDEFVSSLDIFPTILSACNVQPPDNVILDGNDILPVLKGEESSNRKKMFWELRGGFAARVENYKWVDDFKGNQGFYDLSNDPMELDDLTESNPKQLEIVKKEFREWQAQMEDAENRGPFKDF